MFGMGRHRRMLGGQIRIATGGRRNSALNSNPPFFGLHLALDVRGSCTKELH